MSKIVVLQGSRVHDAIMRLCATAYNFHSAAVGKVRGGVVYWRGRVFGECGEAGGGESGGAVVKLCHGVVPPKKARFALGIDHEGVRVKAHLGGMFGPSSFVLKGE